MVIFQCLLGLLAIYGDCTSDVMHFRGTGHNKIKGDCTRLECIKDNQF